MKSRNKKRGFTLLEILVYLAVFAIIMVGLTSFIIWVWHSHIKTQVIRETLTNGRGALEKMVYEIREAQSIYSPTTTSTQLSLETWHYLPEGETSTYIDFFLCGSQLCLKKEGLSPIPLTSEKVEVKRLNFWQVAATSTTPSIQINLELSYKNPQNRPEYQASFNATSTASLRSY